MEDLGATVPYVLKSCNLRCTKICASVLLNNLIYTEIQLNNYISFKFFTHILSSQVVHPNLFRPGDTDLQLSVKYEMLAVKT